MQALAFARRARQVILAAAILLAASRDARANGRYPAASLISFDPGNANHFVVSVTFGLLETRDGGKTFLWRCESLLGAKEPPQDLVVATTASGATVTAKLDGILTSADGCSFRQAPEFAGKVIIDLSLSRSAPHSVVAIETEPFPDGSFSSQVVRSDDDGQTWSTVSALPGGEFLPGTIDVAPSDASRVYVTGRVGKDKEYGSILLRSSDGGRTFLAADIPETSTHRLAYIGAVHPSDPNRVYLRTYDPVGTLVWISDDGGVTFRKVFAGTDQLYGFAVSPDGTKMAVGGPSDGVWVGAADGTGLARRSDVLPNCLGWSDEGLWVCADQRLPPCLSLGLSHDFGTTFESRLRFADLGGQTGCAANTATGSTCPGDWPAIASALGATCGVPDAGPADAADGGARPNDGERPETSDGGDASNPDDPGKSPTGDSESMAPASIEAGGGCSLAPRGALSRGGWRKRGPRADGALPDGWNGGWKGAWVLLFLLWVRRRDQILTIT